MIATCFTSLAEREIFLNPGETGCGFRHEVFGTLLGSCVAICLWHPKRQFGSISHFILPGAPPVPDVEGKYGNTAFAHQQRDLIRHGVEIRECVAKIFGGGQMFVCASMPDIGQRNIAMARELVAGAGLSVAAENVGGTGYRRLYFDVESGEVWVKFDWLGNEQEDQVL